MRMIEGRGGKGEEEEVWANLQDVAAKVLLVLDLQRYALSLLGYCRARLDFVVAVAAVLAVGRHD